MPSNEIVPDDAFGEVVVDIVDIVRCCVGQSDGLADGAFEESDVGCVERYSVGFIDGPLDGVMVGLEDDKSVGVCEGT